MPEVSVIISTYNFGHYLTETIQSVLAQTFQDFELIIVDDGSIDHTRQIVAGFGDAVRYIYQENQGYAAARNTAIRQSAGSLIAFLDADDVWLPHKLELQTNYFARHPEVGVVSANCYFMDATSRVTGAMARKPQPTGWIFERLLLTGNFILTPTVAVRRRCFAEAGLFDESLRTTADWDLWLRFSRKYLFGYLDQPVAKYRLHDANMHKNVRRKAQDTLAIFDKLFSEPDLSPTIRNKQNQAYSAAHLNIAWRYLIGGRSDVAKFHLWRALTLYPRQVLTPFYLRLLLGSFVGSRLYTTLRGWRDAWRRRSLVET
jgi:glycosyltransferase involved in cell wall biosynthesis